ncbi:Pex19 protein family-domain-containing protein [Diplogelasinospora grovesii]|uniref:Pex19 protein family-domain-containing protein n=1 Tax=Diplogelasinospora grovesii TaxID=303347 RepID=A0AAN6NBE1_9PEZI|nr:Pex19 protein family-domain-containing protein [Diplogelasinospora grovesii]
MESKAGDIGAPKDEVEQTAPRPTMAADKQAAVEDVGDVPDPDEDDLDDLDDFLDEFSAVKVDSKKPEVPSGPGRPDAGSAPAKDAAPEDVLSDDDFAKQLQAGMADLLGELENSPEMQAQFESIFKELGAAAASTDDAVPTPAAKEGPSSSKPSAATTSSAATSSADASFQETIRRTMERMQTSGEQATAAAAAEGSDDFLAELLKQMQSGGPEGEGNEEEFSKMLLGMMEQLTNKEILYEPMKELNDKFPDWMEKNREKTSNEDLKRYDEQQRLVKEIVAKFEEPTFSDSNTADREYIVDRMQKMQAAGSPPADLVGDMPSAQDALNMPDESCNPQ